MLVAGIMSGTSADGINVALLQCSGKGWRTRLQLLAHREQPFAPKVRRAILSAMNAEAIGVAELARLNALLGELYAEAVLAIEKESGLRCELIGCHGQTIYHQGDKRRYLGRELACTWQTGEPSVVAARTGRPVVADFRPADIAAGGKGAPFVPYLDYLLYRHPRRGRIVQNIGGIANLTAIPAAAKPAQLAAFDTGPGNMVLDALAQHFYGKAFDPCGSIAATGSVDAKLLASLLRQPFFRRPWPKTAGREQFGAAFVASLIARAARLRPQDLLATATALTAASIAQAVAELQRSNAYRDCFVSGGGVHNQSLMRMLGERLSALGLELALTDGAGLPGDAKEAAAFALLAYETWHRVPSNVPSATGAARPAILGKICHV
jgi:anhydro-N-acetylmuramic acid kinase